MKPHRHQHEWEENSRESCLMQISYSVVKLIRISHPHSTTLTLEIDRIQVLRVQVLTQNIIQQVVMLRWSARIHFRKVWVFRRRKMGILQVILVFDHIKELQIVRFRILSIHQKHRRSQNHGAINMMKISI